MHTKRQHLNKYKQSAPQNDLEPSVVLGVVEGAPGAARPPPPLPHLREGLGPVRKVVREEAQGGRGSAEVGQGVDGFL